MAQQKILLENHMLATLFIMIFVFSLMFCLMMQLYSLVCLSVRDAQVTICVDELYYATSLDVPLLRNVQLTQYIFLCHVNRTFFIVFWKVP